MGGRRGPPGRPPCLRRPDDAALPGGGVHAPQHPGDPGLPPFLPAGEARHPPVGGVRRPALRGPQGLPLQGCHLAPAPAPRRRPGGDVPPPLGRPRLRGVVREPVHGVPQLRSCRGLVGARRPAAPRLCRHGEASRRAVGQLRDRRGNRQGRRRGLRDAGRAGRPGRLRGHSRGRVRRARLGAAWCRRRPRRPGAARPRPRLGPARRPSRRVPLQLLDRDRRRRGGRRRPRSCRVVLRRP